jgi:hypothetical protein
MNGVCIRAVSWRTVLQQAGRSWFQPLMGVFEIFHWPNPSGHTMALWGNGGWCVRLTTLPPSCADCLKIPGVSISWSTEGQSRRLAFMKTTDTIWTGTAQMVWPSYRHNTGRIAIFIHCWSKRFTYCFSKSRPPSNSISMRGKRAPSLREGGVKANGAFS